MNLKQKKDCYTFFVIDDLSSSQTQQGPYDLEETTTLWNANLNGKDSEMLKYKLGELDVANINNKILEDSVTIFLGPEKESKSNCGIMGGTRRNKFMKSKKSRKSKKSKKSKKSRKSRKSRRSRK